MNETPGDTGRMRWGFVRCVVLAIGIVSTVQAVQAADEDDPVYARGHTVAMVCRGCHTVSPEQLSLMKGPSLAGIMGRKAGTLHGYADYSDAMKQSGIVWSPEVVEKYIANPQALVPGNKMAFVGLSDPADRKAVVLYLSKVTVAAPVAAAPQVFTLKKAELGPNE